MTNTQVNPWDWSKRFGFSQAIAVDAPQRMLLCSGQTAIAADGSPPPASADMRSQVAAAADNLRSVVEAAGMSAADVVRMTIYTTDVDELVASFQSLLGLFPHEPALTLIGVSRLAYPELKVEIEAIAVQA